MRNVLVKSCRENENTHFRFSNFFFFFSDNGFVCVMSKNLAETEGSHMTSQYGAYALRAGLARPYARVRMHTRPSIHMHVRICKHACTDQYVILFHSNNGFANALRCYVIRTLPVLFSVCAACLRRFAVYPSSRNFDLYQ
jgi:hypothetical protein